MDTQSKLNAGQQAAADGFFEFLFGEGRELIISGPGGVGKTFLMGHLIDEIIPRYHQMCQMMSIPAHYSEVAMTATTNKAAEVLGLAAKRPTKTIHSLLKLRVMGDFETGQTRLVKGRDAEVLRNKIIFVDEASMIDYQLLQHIREGTFRCKIIYVGDHCQLAPVMEPISPIYRENFPFYELTEQMRNNGQPALMDICNQLRNTVETKQFQPIRIVPGVIDHLSGPAMQQEIARAFKELNHKDRILAYTNNQVMAYNDHIRSDLRQIREVYVEGDTMVNNSAIPRPRMAVEEEYEILSLGDPTTHTIDVDVELEVVPAKLRGAHMDNFEVFLPLNKAHHTDLVKYYAKVKNWPKHFLLKENYPDLRPRDAATIHKSQGSTYDTVFIDLSDLSTCRDPGVVSRLLYVAFSRARQRIVLYGKLAPKYGGLIR